MSQAIGRHVINKFISQAIGRHVWAKFPTISDLKSDEKKNSDLQSEDEIYIYIYISKGLTLISLKEISKKKIRFARKSVNKLRKSNF